MSPQSRAIDGSSRVVFVLWRLLGLITVWALVPALVGDNEWQRYGWTAFCIGTGLLALVASVRFVREKGSQAKSKDFKALCAIVGILVAFIALFGPYFLVQQRVRSRVINDVRGLVDACRQLGDPGPVTLRGKALVWYMSNDSECVVNDMLPSDLKAGGVRPQDFDVAIAYWPEKTAVGMVTVTGDAPPSTRPVRQQSEMGAGPFKRIAAWIAALPRS